MINQDANRGPRRARRECAASILAQALHRTSRLPVAQACAVRARVLKPPDERERAAEIVSVEDRLVDVLDAECRESLGSRFPRMANWGPEVEWHERDVVVPFFREWLGAQGWETETEAGFVYVVARRGNETIYAEAKGRTKGRPGAGLDALYGQLLRRMPPEEVGDSTTRFAVVIPTGAEAAALRVPRRIRDLLRIDVYAVSDDRRVEKLAD